MDYLKQLGYVKGLAEGLGLDESDEKSRILRAIIDCLEQMSEAILELRDTTEELEDEISNLDADLEELADDVEEALDDFTEEMLESVTRGLGGSHLKALDFDDDEDEDEDEDEDDDEDELYELECPNCKETLVINEDMLEEGGVECPGCHEKLEFEIHFDESCDCGHDHGHDHDHDHHH